jgi:hypothetical protein
MNISQKQIEDFAKLHEDKKILRIEKSLRELMIVFQKQISLLRGYNNSSVNKKEIGFGYFYKTVLITFDNLEHALKLGKGKYRHFNIYPTRAICENVFRLEYYINQNKDKQNEICLLEMTRIMKRFYDETKDLTYKEYYDKTIKDFGNKSINYPNIEEEKAYKDPFPSIQELMRQSKLPNVKNFYMHYRFLSESHHNKLISIFIAENQKAQYRRNIFYLNILCRWILIIIDSHIQNVTKKDVENVIKKTDEIIFGLNKSDI